ncbi:MAG TPA: PBP1A family penicillin-binding protein [Thermoanaerobaculia bacterium]|nr:PBP1A family penicillin-binding protein [Thermoanaerobaculia bacterium]
MDAMTLPRRTSWRERWHRARRPVAIVLAVSYGIVLFLAFAWSQCFFDGCPNVKSLAAYQPGGAPVLLDRNGEVFADLTPVEREVVPLFSLPSHVSQAFLAVEDKRFYEHNGIDWRRVGGAVLANLRSGDFSQGFSTVTMQLARNLFPNRIPGEEQTPRRKLLEVRVAREIENEYSKDEILELYLNHIYFGNRARGIEAAAHQYFGHPAEKLTLPEAALLAALPKAPTHYDPRRHPEKARERRNLVISLMEEQGRIPWIEAREARKEPLGLAPAPRQARVESGLAPYFVEQVRRELEERFGPALYTRPLRVVTTLDSRIQRAAEEELLRQLKLLESGELGTFQGPRYSALAASSLDGTPYLQGAFVLLDARGGDVLAWVGGRNYAHSQFDRVAQARRQPGSAFKPFVYAAALEEGFVLSQPLVDRPVRVRLPGGRVWEPKNFSGRYEGRVTMRDALVRSKNVATVRLATAIGLGQVAGVAREAGIEPITQVPAMVLGTVAVSPLELTSAYSAFAGLGEAVEPRLVLRVEDEEGKVFWSSRPSRQQVLEPPVSFLVTDVLSEALERGTGTMVREVGVQAPAAGKTGTTNDGADVWFVGYTPDLVGGVWIGFDKPRPILNGSDEATGGRLAAPVWGRIVRRAYQRRPRPKSWETPPGVVSHRVDPQTGLLLEPGCSPTRGQAYEELFVEGIEPAAYCPGKESAPRDGFPAARMIAERKARQAEEEALLAQARETEERRLRERQEAERQARLAEEQRKRQEEDRLVQIGEARRRAAEEARTRREREEKERQALLAAQKRQEEQRLAQIAEARQRAEQEAREQEEQRKKAALLAQQKEREERDRIARAEAEEKRREEEAAAERERKEREAARLAEVRKQQEKERKEREAAELRERKERLARAEAEADLREREIEAREDALRRGRRTGEDETARETEDERIARVLDEERRAREKEDEEARAAREREEEERPADREDDPEEEEDAEEAAPETDLSGWWEMTNTIQSTNYSAYKGLRLGYRIQLEQEGDRIVGRGQKWTENGRTLPSSARTPITVTGTIDGREIKLTFTEQGTRRSTSGGFSWTLSADRTALRGSFWSDAADASGRSLARRMP